jgi:hypothetical protein
MKLFTLTALTLLLTACATSAIDNAIVYHAKAAPYVELGMSEEAFVALMEPAMTPSKAERQPRRFSRGDDMYVVHFMRVARVPDDLYTDDEYQPYTFANGKLVAVGWEYLGGEKYTTQDLRQRAASADKTNVNVRQSTTVNTGTSSSQCMPDLNGDGFCSGYRCC